MRAAIMMLLLIITAAGLLAAIRYHDNGNGTVKDNGTGLNWQKCSMGQDEKSCSGDAALVNWLAALNYCRNLTLAGKSWRLPNVNELKSLVDYSRTDPAINTRFFPNTGTPQYYWSSTTEVITAKSNAWGVEFLFGTVDDGSKTGSRLVRCVTDGP